jgi:glycosyltransferase involved in cell wall biosynthesis
LYGRRVPESLIVTLDPILPGGVITMQNAVSRAHRSLGLTPHLGFARLGGRRRWNPAIEETDNAGQPCVSTGYVPSIEYLNYLLPAIRLRKIVRRFPIVQVVTGIHSAGLIPIFARRPFVSWIATPFLDEISSRREGDASTTSVKVNYALRAVNQRLERWSLRFPSLVFALSDYTARRLREVGGANSRNLAVLRCPIDLEELRPDGPAWDGKPGRYLLSVGRVDDPRKNMGSLVRAFSLVAPQFPDLHLVILGKAQRPDNEVARLVQSLGLAERVHFPGHRAGSELAAIYRSAEAFVLTSRQEGLGIVVMEAQASGVPVVVMRCGGSDELISTADRDGWLIDQGDEGAFADALRALAGNAELRATVGANARRKAEREFGFDVFTARLRDAYRDVFPDVASLLT